MPDSVKEQEGSGSTAMLQKAAQRFGYLPQALQLVESGTHAELLRRDRLYAESWSAQMEVGREASFSQEKILSEEEKNGVLRQERTSFAA